MGNAQGPSDASTPDRQTARRDRSDGEPASIRPIATSKRTSNRTGSRLAWWEEEAPEQLQLRTQLLPDRSQTIIASNDSPDVPFQLQHQSVSRL